MNTQSKETPMEATVTNTDDLEQVLAGLPPALAKLLGEAIAQRNETERVERLREEERRQESWWALVRFAEKALGAMEPYVLWTMPHDWTDQHLFYLGEICLPGLASIGAEFERPDVKVEWTLAGYRVPAAGRDHLSLPETLLLAFDHRRDEEIPF